jgi:UDP-perosamine 4-acetyltransferase
MADRTVYLLAAGGHGSVVLDALLEMGVRVAGIVDPAKKPGGKVFDVPVVGGDEWLDERDPAGTLLANGAGAVPHQDLRARLFERFSKRGFGFIAVRHPSAVVGRDATLAEGSQVMAGVVVQCRVTIGRNSVVNTCVSVDHDCVVGDHVFIGPGATLCGEVRVGQGAFVGAGSTLMPGVTIGDRAIVGAGAVVHRHVPEGALVTGVPAKRQTGRNP